MNYPTIETQNTPANPATPGSTLLGSGSAPEAQGAPVNSATEIMPLDVRPDNSWAAIMAQLPPQSIV